MVKLEPRISDEELALYCSEFLHGPPVTDLAQDLRDARAEIRALERELAELR